MLPRVLVIHGAAERSLVLPAWPPDVEDAALSERATVRDTDLVSLWFGVEACTFMPGDLARSLAQDLGAPPKQRSGDRARTWLIARWPRVDVRRRLIATGVFVNLEKQHHRVVARLKTADARAAARTVAHVLKETRDYDPSLPARFYVLFLEGWGPEAAAELVWHDPAVKRSFQAALEEIDKMDLTDSLQQVWCALEFLAADRQTRHVTQSPEAVLPAVQHQLEEARAVIRSLQVRAEAAENDLAELVSVYEGILRREGPGGDPKITDPPLAGLRVAIAGDPSHASGYRELCAALGAVECEVLDATSDNPQRIAQRLARADLPVLVTAYAKHRTQEAILAVLDRDRLLLVPTAGLAAFREAVLKRADATRVAW